MDIKKIYQYLILALFLFTNSSYAIKNGEADNGEHPYVGLAVYSNEYGQLMRRCSGTLIAPTVYLTAGHCTHGAARAAIWFEEDIESGIGENGYPHGNATTIRGKSYTHPNYNPMRFTMYDLGVVILDTPVMLDKYAVLPEVGLLDVFFNMRGLQDTTMTAVGYGLQKINPVQRVGERIRLKAVLGLVGINGILSGVSVSLTSNARTGGTCFGDSGGPLFKSDTNIVAAVTSYGLNGNCAGISGGYRVDTDDDLNWLYNEFGTLLY